MKPRTMYMHTLDGKPASYEDTVGGPHVYFVVGRSRVRLVSRLDQIRREHQATLRNPNNRTNDGASNYATNRLGYMRVEVPV